jgi:hypothetical protein
VTREGRRERSGATGSPGLGASRDAPERHARVKRTAQGDAPAVPGTAVAKTAGDRRAVGMRVNAALSRRLFTYVLALLWVIASLALYAFQLLRIGADVG